MGPDYAYLRQRQTQPKFCREKMSSHLPSMKKNIHFHPEKPSAPNPIEKMRPRTSAHSFKLAILLDDLTREICCFLQLNTANDPERIQETEGETSCGNLLLFP